MAESPASNKIIFPVSRPGNAASGTIAVGELPGFIINARSMLLDMAMFFLSESYPTSGPSESVGTRQSLLLLRSLKKGFLCPNGLQETCADGLCTTSQGTDNAVFRDAGIGSGAPPLQAIVTPPPAFPYACDRQDLS